jgi:hypothetical protein
MQTVNRCQQFSLTALAAAAATAFIVALELASEAIGSSTPPSRSSCAATTVRYQPANHRTLHDVPWVLARPAGRGVLGFIVSYAQMLRDRRVNGSDGLVLWRTGARIVWAGASSPSTVVGHRLDGRGSFRLRLVASTDGLVSEPRFPTVGCWRLSVGGEATIAVRVVSRPRMLGCDATPLREEGAFARPLSSGIRGGWGPWRTSAGGALIYTHGHGAGLNMKVPWWVDGEWGQSLNLSGSRLDAEGSFAQEFPMASSPAGVFPSTVDVPAAGCWLFRLRTGRLAGVLVVRAVDDP